MDRLPTWGATKTLADYVKESAWQTNSVGVISSNNSTGGASNSTTSMPWAAAVKSPPDLHHQQNQQQQQHHLHQQNHHHQQHQQSIGANNQSSNQAFDGYNGTIGSWSSPETSSSNRGGWNADGSSKSDGIFDDGTAIWGNPTTKKTGVDWTEKESLLSPPQAQANNNSEKRIQKPEPTITSIDGTEVWGAPVRSQQPVTITKNDNSGNIYGTKSSANHDSTGSNSSSGVDSASGNGIRALSSSSSLGGWGESFSRQQQQQQATQNENSSPPNSSASIWNNLGVNKQKSSDWLSSSSGISVGNGSAPTTTLTNSGFRMDDLNKQLEMTSLFDSAISPMAKGSPSPGTSNNNSSSLGDQHSIGLGLGNYISNNGVCNIGGGNNMNDLNKMSANYPNDLLASPNRQPCGLSTRNNQQSQQLDSAAYSSSGSTPSRDLLKQMVHQIQLAVQAGHLNAHILNQPMSTPTLQLVYQLLQQIKTLHQLQEIQQRAGIKSDINSPSNMDLQINRIRQNISLLQKAITQQQATLTKNETLVDPSSATSSSSSLSSNLNKQPQPIQQQQQQQQAVNAAAAAAAAVANNYSYATISKQSTNNLKVFSNNNMSNIINNSNIDSFKRSSLIDTLINSNSDQLRSSQSPFDGGNANLDKTLSSLIQSSSTNNILGSNKTITTSDDYPKAQSFTCGNSSSGNTNGNVNNNVGLSNNQQQQAASNKGLLPAQSSASSSSTSSSAWSSAFSSGDFLSQQQQQAAWPMFLKTNNNGNGANSSVGAGSSMSGNNTHRAPIGLYDWGDLVSSSTLQFSNNDINNLGKQPAAVAVGTPSSIAIGGGRPAPPPGLTTSNFGPIIGGSSSASSSSNGIWSNLHEYND